MTAAAPDPQARAQLALLGVLASAVVAVEACLVAPGHLLAAQIVDGVLVMVIVNLAMRDRSRMSKRAARTLAALRALALVPLIRVAGMGLPIKDRSDAFGVLTIALALGVAVLVLAPTVGISRRRFVTLRMTVPHLYAVVGGAALGFVAFLTGAPALWTDGDASDAVALALAAAVCAAIVEEVVFRGVLQLTFERAAGALGAFGATAIFAALYLDAGSVALVLTYALAGFVFARSVSRSGALGGAVIGHVLLAVGAGALWPIAFDRTVPVDLHEPYTSILLTAAIGAVATIPHGLSDRQP